MRRIDNSKLQDIVELDGCNYLVSSTFEEFWGRGYETTVETCDSDGRTYYFSRTVCHVFHEPAFDAVEKGHADIVSNLDWYMADYKAKQEEERKKREEEQKKARSTINKMFDTFHSTFATSYSSPYINEQRTTISNIINAAIRGSWAHNPEED